jgi:hypothetical protein
MKVAQDTTPIVLDHLPLSNKASRFNHSQTIDIASKDFYVAAMAALATAGLPFLVGGAYAFAHYSGIDRHTKDFDIFVKKEDADRILDHLGKALKCKTDRTFPHWLYKAILGENFIDIIFRYPSPSTMLPSFLPFLHSFLPFLPPPIPSSPHSSPSPIPLPILLLIQFLSSNFSRSISLVQFLLSNFSSNFSHPIS